MAAEKPYKIIDRRGSAGRRLYDAVTQTVERPVDNGFDRDTRNVVRPEDRRTLMSIGRKLYSTVSAVRACVDEQATLAAGNLTVQFDGEDAAWGAQAEAWLTEHDRICDVRGYPYDMQAICRLAILHVVRDGDFGIILTEGEGGFPLFQLIPSHRIRGDHKTVPEGIFKDRQLLDGVAVNDYGRHVGYRLAADDGSNSEVRDVSATDMVLTFLPDFADQIRGISRLATAAIEWKDFGDSRKYELIAQKIGASIALVESNETGTVPDDAKELILGRSDSSGNLNPGLHAQLMHGGETRYFRNGAGKLEALRLDRPTQNQREFAHDIARHALASMGWSIDFSLDPTRIGGAPARIAAERVNRTLKLYRNHILFPLRRRLDAWRIAKAIKIGQLPPSDEWMKWRYQGASDVTADAKYSFDVASGQLAKGLTSEQSECAKLGNDWESVMDDKIAYAVRLRDKCKAAGIDPAEIRQIATTSFQAFSDPQALEQQKELAEIQNQET